jgi:hypothetical protein
MYASASIVMQPIQPSYLFSGSAHANGSPFELYVSPSTLCASTSTIEAQPQVPSIWTAGSTVSMTVKARDMYGNWKTKSDLDASKVFVRSKAIDNSAVAVPGSALSPTYPLLFSVSQQAFKTGLTTIDASFVLQIASGRGMHATYYRCALQEPRTCTLSHKAALD